MAAHRTMIALLLVVVFGSTVFAQGDSEPIRIYFAPPDGTRFVRTTTIEKGLVFENGPDPEVEELRIQHEFKWRRTSRGYSLTMSPLRDSDLNTRARKLPGLAAVMLQNDFVINYDVDGTYQAISGLDRALDLTLKNMPPQFKSITAQGLTGLKQGFEQLWVGRFALARLTRVKPVFVGRQWGGNTQMPYGALGTLDFKFGARIYGWDVFNGKRCLVIESKAITDDPALANMSGLLDQAIREMVAIMPLSRADEQAVVTEITKQTAKLRLKSITEENVRAIDPATYLTCKEQTTRILAFDWIEGGVVQDAGTAVEIHTLEYDYR